MLTHFTQLTVLLLSSLAFAQAPNPTCQPIRQGRAEVSVYRLYWEQRGGSYHIKRDTVCKIQGAANVYQGALGTCIYPVLADCPIQLDGESHKINVSGIIQLRGEPRPKTKEFTVSYHLDRNSGNITTGEAGSAHVESFNPDVERMKVSVQSKLDGVTPGIPVRDAVEVNVEFHDAP